MKLSRAASRIRPPVFADLQARIDEVVARGGEIIPFQIGDTFLAPPAGARRALAALDPEDASLFRYGATVGTATLRDRFAAVLSARTEQAAGVRVDPQREILLGNGGTHALFCAARAVLDEGDEVIVLSPYWPLAPGVFTSTGAVPVEAPLTQRLYDDPSFDLGPVLEAARTDRTRAVYFASPNNPDGKVLSATDLGRIGAFASKHDLWIFADEVYADTTFGPPHVSIAALSPDLRARTIALSSLSKSHALAGARIGFAVAPEAVVAHARRVSTHSAFNVSVAMQRIAEAALEDTAFPEAARATYLEARDVASAALAGAPARFHVPDGSTYLFVDFAPLFADAPPRERPLLHLLELAVDRGVVLAPGDAFGAYPTHARLCFTSVPVAKVKEGVSRLVDAIAAYAKG